MLHALPWFLVIGMSLVVRLDPNLPSLSRVDPLSLFLLKSLGLALAYFSRGILQHKCYFSIADAIISMILEMVSFSVPCEMYPAQSLRIHCSFHNTPSLRSYIKEDMLWKREICFTSRYCQHVLKKKCFQQVRSYFSKIRII